MSQWVDPDETPTQQPAPAYTQHAQEFTSPDTLKIDQTVTVIHVQDSNTRTNVVHYSNTNDDFDAGCCLGCMGAICYCGLCIVM